MLNYEATRRRVQPWLDNGTAVMLRRFSEAAALDFADASLDFVYIDAGHEYHNVARDLDVWWPKLKARAMLAGDDFADVHDSAFAARAGASWGVKSAVVNFSSTVGSPFFLTFADRPHFMRPSTLSDGPEFESDTAATLKVARHSGILRPVRAQSFFPAYYMFK